MKEFKGTPGPWFLGGVENEKESVNAIALAYDTQDNAGNYRAATGVYEAIAAGKIPGVKMIED